MSCTLFGPSGLEMLGILLSLFIRENFYFSLQAHLSKLAKDSIEKNRSDDVKAVQIRAEQREQELNMVIEQLENRHGKRCSRRYKLKATKEKKREREMILARKKLLTPPSCTCCMACVLDIPGLDKQLQDLTIK